MLKKLLKSIAILFGIAGCAVQAERITLAQLPETLDKLVQGKMEYNFFGITSNRVDCIYFAEEKGYINIEFEAMIKEQIQYIAKLKSFANERGYSVSETTYGNKPQYKSDSDAPVIVIKTHANVADAAKIGVSITKEIFGNNDSTVFDVVP